MAKKKKASGGANIVKILCISFGGVFGLLFLFLLFAPQPSYKTGWRTLTDVQSFAKNTKELVPIDTENTLRPVFDKFYKKHHTVTFLSNFKKKISWLLSFVFLSKPPIFSASYFKYVLTKLGKERIEKKWTGNLIKKITISENARIIVFGNVQGAFHSMSRCFTKLKDLGIIDNNLKIIKPEHYIVFMGDVVSRSHLTMETLGFVMRLMEVNGDKIVYLRGNHESKNYWQEHALKRELQFRAKHLSDQTLPLEKEVNDFFNTLPLALYLNIPNAPVTDVIRISDTSRRKSKILFESKYEDFLMKTGQQKIATHIVKDGEGEQSSSVQVKVILKGEKKRESYQKMEGLRFLAPDIDSVAWNVLSCPTYVYRRAIKFSHDAFVVLVPGPSIDKWTINLFSRDASKEEPFKETNYFLLSGVNTKTNTKIERYRPKPKKKKQAKESEKKIEVKKEEKAVKQELLPAVSKKLIRAYLVEKVLTPEQWNEVFEKILTKEQKEKIMKKLSQSQEQAPKKKEAKKAEQKAMIKQESVPLQKKSEEQKQIPKQSIAVQQGAEPVEQQKPIEQTKPKAVQAAPSVQPVPHVQQVAPPAPQPQEGK